MEYAQSVNVSFGDNIHAFDELDKPKLHGIIELVVHTVSKYVNALIISELDFKDKHRAIKHIYRRGNNLRNHMRFVKMELWKKYVAHVHLIAC